jgi:hypothetical protein
MANEQFTIKHLLTIHAAGGILEGSNKNWDAVDKLVDPNDTATLAFVAKWKEYAAARTKFEQEVNEQFRLHNFPVDTKF